MNLTKEIDRIGMQLCSEDPASERYTKLLSTLSCVASMVKQFGDLLSADASAAAEPSATIQATDLEQFPGEPLTHTETASSVPSKDLTTTATNKPEELTPEYVRGLLMDVSQGGTVVQPLVAKYTPEGKPPKFSSIPKERYSEFVEELKTYAG